MANDWRLPFNETAAKQGWIAMLDARDHITIVPYPYLSNTGRGRFRSEEEAEAFVKAQAAAGDETAKAAVAMLVKQLLEKHK